MNYQGAIKAWRKHRQLTQAGLGELCGYEHAQSRIANYESTNPKTAREPDMQDLRTIADALGLPGIPELLYGPNESFGIAEPMLEYMSADYVEIPLLDGFLSKGPGGQDTTAEVVKHLHFRRDWIRSQGWNPKSLWAIASRGDSMPGLVDEADIMVVNRDDVWPVSGRSARERVFAIKTPSGDLAKELIYDEGNQRLIVRSWNPDKGRWPDEHYGPDDLENSIYIMGRIIWRGGNL